jgi:RNA recognition motif-containing protein
MNIYVGNLSTSVNEEDLTKLFSGYGNISRVKIIKDAYTGVSKGFGFVEMTGKPEEAIKQLDKKDFKGKVMTVNEARSKNNTASGPGSRGVFSNYSTGRSGKW